MSLTVIFSSWPLRMALRAIVLAAAFVAIAASGNARAAGPLDALRTAQQGIDQSDSDAFSRAVDITSVTDGASDALLAALRKQMNEGTLGDSNMGMALMLADMAESSGQAGMIKQLLISEVRGFVTSGINGGYFAGKPNGTVKPSRGSLASTLTKMPEGRRELIPGKILSEKDGKAVVSATFVDPKAGRFPLELGLTRQDGQWRVTEIVNAQALFEQAARGK